MDAKGLNKVARDLARGEHLTAKLVAETDIINRLTAGVLKDVKAAAVPFSKKEFMGWKKAKAEWISENDAYNKQHFGITKEKYNEIQKFITDKMGIVSPNPKWEEITASDKSGKEYVVWGLDPKKYSDKWLKLNSGSYQECLSTRKSRMKDGWDDVRILPKGKHPTEAMGMGDGGPEISR